MQIRLRISTVGKCGHQRVSCRKRTGGQGSFAVWGPRSDSRTWVLREVRVLLQLALTPPASGSMGALRASPTGSGAVAVERFSSISMFLGSLLCHIIKGKQLQKSFQSDNKKGSANHHGGPKITQTGGVINSSTEVQLLSCHLARCWACTSITLKSAASYSTDLSAHPGSSISSAVL